MQLVHLDAAGKRGSGTALACRPLPALLTLTGLAASPSFADPTQQPLRLAGPLAAAIVAGGYAVDPMFLREGHPDAPLAEGFDLVVACAGRGAADIRADEGAPRLSGPGWVLLGAPALMREVTRDGPLSPPPALP